MGQTRKPSAGEKPGLWRNIQNKRKRIAAGSGEKMRPPGAPGAPTAAALKASAATAKKKPKPAPKKRTT